MESQPQNPEFRNNPENFHPCILFSFSSKQIWCAIAIESCAGRSFACNIKYYYLRNQERYNKICGLLQQ